MTAGRRTQSRRRRPRLLAGTFCLVGIIVLASGMGTDATASSTEAGSQGTDVSLPATDSQVTVHGQGAFSNLAVTVNQTKNLVNQAISVSWTGGDPTFSDPTSQTFSSTFNGDYLQMFECWGDPQSVNPPDTSDPGPLPTQCQFGGESSSPLSAYPIKETGFEYSRVLASSGWSTYSQLTNSPIAGSSLSTWTDPSTGFTVEPFQPVDGSAAIDQQANYNFDNDVLNPQKFWLNPYFSYQTTNEVDFARTYSGGTGQQLFEVDTGLEAPGLGCGQNIQPVAGGTKAPQCWLVIVPRSTPTVENPAGLTGVTSVQTSPLTPSAWQNRIAIPLEFNPVGSDCPVGANTERVEGGELAGTAFASWEQGLCASGSSYSYIQNNDDQARENLTNPTYGSVGMSVFSDPIDPSDLTSSDPVVYAPLSLSAVVVAFNIERSPALASNGQLQPDEVGLSGSRVAHIYLTPRLVAKLLTESYQAQFESVTRLKPAGYGWVQGNPTSLFSDPDFLQYNPEFALLTASQKVDAGTLLVEESSSDAATALWTWVLADPAARKWLSGVPDQWGMQVNPYYSTNTDDNPSTEAFGSPIPNTYPKSDPYCYQDPTATVVGTYSGVVDPPARPLCLLDWTPYALTMQAAALATASANDGAKTTLDPTQEPNSAWTSNGPQKTGSTLVMSITDSASAARYGLQDASLSRAGDDGSNPTFVTPDSAGILAGEAAMVPSATSDVLQDNPSTTAPGAYPLPMLTYGATTPESLVPADRQSYSSLIRYIAGPGQVSGPLPGELPAGYVPLPASLAAQSVTAAASVLNPPAQTTTSTASTTPAGSPTSAPASFPSYDTSTPASTPDATSTAGTPTTTRNHLGSTALIAVRTKGVPIGAVRWVLLIVLIVGLIAIAASFVLGRGERGVRPSSLPPIEGGKG